MKVYSVRWSWATNSGDNLVNCFD